CAALQGTDAFDNFHQLCFRTQHLEGRSVAEKTVLLDIAQKANLDMECFEKNLISRNQRPVVAKEHEEAVEQLGIFGVPTIIYPTGDAIFVKLASGSWENHNDDGLFDQLTSLIVPRSYLIEVKRAIPAQLPKTQ
ncbi:MAG: DsbA family protein, partial [Thermodesulfobacteriota bacterium]|nr:DsbA family protein [Thermodesulfobacteriota bacterium]